MMMEIDISGGRWQWQVSAFDGGNGQRWALAFDGGNGSQRWQQWTIEMTRGRGNERMTRGDAATRGWRKERQHNNQPAR